MAPVEFGVRRVLSLGEGAHVRTVVVRELTLAEFRDWLADVSTSRDRDVVHALLHDDRDCADLMRFTDLDEDAIEHLTPSQIRRVWGAVEEVNADFFGLLGRLEEASRPSDSSQTSNGPQ